MNTEPDSTLVSVRQAADMLCVSAATVHRWIAEGALPVQHNREAATWIRAADVEALRRSRIWVTPSATPIWPTS